MFTLKWSNDSVFYVYDTELQESGIGVSVDWELTYDGGTLDITSWELEFVIRPFAGSDVVATLPNADITTDVDGNISFTTDSAFTTGLNPQTYLFELRRVDDGHEKIIRFGNWALYATPLVAPVATTGGIVPIDLGGTGEDLSLEGPSVIVQLTTGANLTALPADLASTTLFLRKDLTWQVPGGVGTGTVTSVSVVTANGVSGSVATATSTPAITLTLGAITPSSVNSVVISGASTPTLAVTGTTTVSGANTGDQNLFSAIAVSGETTVTANSTTTTLTVVGGTNISVTTDNTTKTITIDATGVGTGTVTSVSVVTANGVSGSVATATTTPAITLTLGAITPSSVNGNTITTGTGTLTLSTFTLTVAGTASVSGTNTGDQTFVTGNAGTVTFVDAGGDTTTWLALARTQTGDQSPATDSGLTYNATTNALTTTTFIGALTGNASTATALQTARSIYGNLFDGTADLTQIIASTFGGTGNGFAKISGPTTSEKTFTLPNASAKILTDNAVVLVTEGGTGRATGTTAYSLIATGITATGAQQTLANGATTEMLVGGGASALPVWTTATGTGAPVRGTNATLTGASVNSVTLSGSSSTLSVTGSSSISGANTGDQNIFASIVVSGQTTVTANSAATALTLVGASNIVITTDNTTKTVTISASGLGTGSVTNVSVVTANGVSGSVANPTSTPAITLTLGAITPTSVNGNTITTGTGTLTLSTFTVTAAANATISGTNTGDQNLFSSIVVSGQTTVTVNSTTTALTLEAGTGVVITTNNTTKTVTIAATASGTVTSVAASGTQGVTISGSPITTTGSLTIGLGAITPTSVNSVVISGSATPTLAVTGTTAVSGTNTGDQLYTASGDATAPSSSNNLALTLAAVNSNVGSFGGASTVPIPTVNAKGLVTAVSTATVIAPAVTLTGTTINSTVVTSSLTSLGTITTGVWQGTIVGLAYGGTGSNLSDPGADRILFWDESANTVTWLTVGAGLAISDTTINATSGGGDFFGPSSSTQNAFVVFANTTGKLGKNSTVTVSDIGAMVIGGSGAALTIGTSTEGVLVFRDSTGANISFTATTNSIVVSGSASISATTFIGSLVGNATTSTTLQTARSVYGNNFNGSADVSGTIALTYGGLGHSLSAPASDKIYFYDVSTGHSDFLTIGAGLSIAGTTLNATDAGGTVTSVSVVTANGVSGSVANPTSTPAITITLGAITPSSVNGNTISTGTGTLTLSTFTLTASGNGSVQGTNTGDQLYTATGDATATSSASNLALTLATVNSNVGTFGSGSFLASFTVNAKGLITAASQTALVAGDFYGPASSTTNAAVTFANTSGKLGQNSTLTIAPSTGVAVLGGSAASFKIGDSTAGILQWRDSSGSTISLTATSNALVLSGTATIAATTFIGNLSGNASTATTLQTTRAIYGNNFNGSADVTGVIALTYGGLGVSLSDPNADRMLFWDDSAGAVTWLTAGSGLAITGTTISVTAGGGDFFGPSSSTDNAIVRFDGTTGKLGQNSVAILDDGGALSIVGGSAGITLTGNSISGQIVFVVTNTSGLTQVATITNLGDATFGSVLTSVIAATYQRASNFLGSMYFQAQDSDDSSYKTFITLSPGSNPTCVFTDVNLGTPTAGVLTNATGLPVTTGLANIASPSFLGRTTASTGAVEVLTVTQATAMLNVMVGDSGSGGTKGLVPAPASGDATKFLTGAGTYVSAGGGTVTSVAVSGANGIGVSGSPITSTGTIALSLGAITPTSVTTTGAIQSGTSSNGVFRWWDAANATTLSITASNNSLTLSGTATLSAVTFIGNLTGNASTATTLQNSRLVYGSNFNGSADISGPIGLGYGGTGRILTDPNADRIMFWDDSAGQVDWLAPSSNLPISGTGIDLVDLVSSGSSTTDPRLIPIVTRDTKGRVTAFGVATITAEASLVTGGEVPVAHGGTGLASVTAFGVICGGSTTTTPFQQPGTGTSGQVLKSNGSGGLPSWSDFSALMNTWKNTVANYTGSVQQVLTHDSSGNFRWEDSEEC